MAATCYILVFSARRCERRHSDSNSKSRTAGNYKPIDYVVRKYRHAQCSLPHVRSHAVSCLLNPFAIKSFSSVVVLLRTGHLLFDFTRPMLPFYEQCNCILNRSDSQLNKHTSYAFASPKGPKFVWPLTNTGLLFITWTLFGKFWETPWNRSYRENTYVRTYW